MIKRFVERYDKQVHRFLEILPGTFSWTLIVFLIWGSFWIPHYVAYYIILFVIFWFYKSAVLAATAVISHLKLNASQKYDWLADAQKLPNFKKVHHLIIVPTYLEPIHILERCLNSIASQDVPKNQISVVMAFEQREGKSARDKAKVLSSKYKNKFANFLVAFHPDVPKEVKGKSSNEAYAGKIAKK